MHNSEIFAIKINILLPNYLKDLEPKACKPIITRQKAISSNVTVRIKELRERCHCSTGSQDMNKDIYEDIESTNRVRSLIKKAKEGSFTEDKSDAQKRIKINHISNELMDTEKRYLESLRILEEISRNVDKIESDQKDVLRDIFKDIPSLYMLHAYMDKEFSKAESDADWKIWVKVFTEEKLAPFFNIYRIFLSRFGTTSALLHTIYFKDKVFQEFCFSIVQTSVFQEHHLQDVPGMYLGIQSRLTRCEMLLSKLEINAPEGQDKITCKGALSIIRNILKLTEKEVNKTERTLQALKIEETLEGRQNKLGKLAQFIRSGPVMKIPRRSMERKPLHRHLFLFSDFLIITDPISTTTGHYTVKSELTVVSMVIEDVKLEDDIQIPHCFRVKAIESVIELAFATEEEMNSWWKTLEDAIESARRENDGLSANAISSNLKRVSNVERAAEWVKDEQATMCALCYKQFSIVKRKHHCRACGKIFCHHCSHYKARVDFIGNREVRVCELDFYRLNPNVKPPTAASMERLAKRVVIGPRFIPYQYGYLHWAPRTHFSWVSKKSHMRVEYSAGLVRPFEGVQTNHGRTSHSSISSSSSSPFVVSGSPSSPPTSRWAFDFASLTDDGYTIPLPAARLTLAPSVSRVYCVLQPDTLLSIYAAKEDAKTKDQVILLGMRLLYLVRLQASTFDGKSEGEQKNYSDNDDDNHDDDDHRHKQERWDDGNQFFSSSSSSSSTSSLNSFVSMQTSRALINQLSQELTTTEKNVRSKDETLRPSRPPFQRAQPVTPSSHRSKSPTTPTHKDPHLFIGDSVFHVSNGENVGQSRNVVRHHIHSSQGQHDNDYCARKLTKEPSLESVNSSVASEYLVEGRFVPSQSKLKISDDCLSVLTNMQGFLILPLNTDRMGHYFEASSEEMRNEWIKKIRSVILEFTKS